MARPFKGSVGQVAWTDSFDGASINPAYAATNSVGTVVDTNSGAGSLRIQTTGTPLTGYLDWGRIVLYLPGLLNFDLTCDVVLNGSVEQYPDFSFRADNGSASGAPDVTGNGYNYEFGGATTGSWINEVNATALTGTVVTETTTAQPGNGTLTKVHLVAYDDQIKTKRWTSGTAGEPDAWQLTYVDRKHYLASGRPYFIIGLLGGASNGCNGRFDNLVISRLNLGRLWSDRRNIYIPAGGGGTAYTDNVTTTIVCDTGNTVDQLSMFESLTTTGVGVTSDVDTAAFQETPLTTAIAVTSETDTAAFQETPATTAVVLTGEADSVAMTESVVTTGVVVTSEVDQLSMVEAPTTVGVVTTSEVDSAAYTESVTTTATGVTSETDVAAFNDNPLTTMIALTGETEQLSMFESVTTTAVGVTSEIDQLSLFEFPTTTGVVSTSESDSAAYVETVNTTALVVTAEDDILNGNPTPGIGFIYQSGPWKVMGRL